MIYIVLNFGIKFICFPGKYQIQIDYLKSQLMKILCSTIHIQSYSSYRYYWTQANFVITTSPLCFGSICVLMSHVHRARCVFVQLIDNLKYFSSYFDLKNVP